MLETIAAADVEAMAGADPYYRGRAAYMAEAARMVRDLSRRRGLRDLWRVLEVGPYLLPIVTGCVTMDRRVWPGGQVGCPGLIHDATVTPWPFAAKALDLVIALQVFEHLSPWWREAFVEVRRVAGSAILSLPYNWPAKAGNHAGITLDVITMWAGGEAPCEHVVVGGGLPRIVCRWEW